jgi:hypothetical protein
MPGAHDFWEALMTWMYRWELRDRRSHSIVKADIFPSPDQLDANKLPNAAVSAVNLHYGAKPYATAMAADRSGTHELIVYEQNVPRGQPSSMWQSPIARIALRQ